MDYVGNELFALLTVAGQLVICTQFPIIPGITRRPFPFDEEIKERTFVLPGEIRVFIGIPQECPSLAALFVASGTLEAPIKL